MKYYMSRKNQSIAHSNYQLGGRIYVNEFDDRIKITNP